MTFNPASIGFMQAAGLEASLMAAQTGVAANQAGFITAESIAPASYSFSDDGSKLRCVVSGLGVVTLTAALAGCQEPPAAPIAHETQLPRNQGSCPPGSRDPFCQGYRASHQQMVEDRTAGHHSDLMFTGILVGAAVLLTVIPTYFIARRRGKKIAELQAARAAQVPQEPKTPPTGGAADVKGPTKS